MYWNGQSWVDQYGAPAGTTPLPQAQAAPKPKTAGTTPSGGDNFMDYWGQHKPATPAPVPAGNQYGRTDMWGYDIFADPWGDRGWEQARSGTSKLFNDYLVGGGLERAQANDRTRQGLYDQAVQSLDSGEEYARIYGKAMGGGADAAEQAANQALALGMDPNSAALGARNSNIVAAHRAASQAYDPQMRAQRIQQLIAMGMDVSQPSFLPMLQALMQYDQFRDGSGQRNRQMDDQSGSGLGSLIGLGLSLLGGGGFNLGSLFGGGVGGNLDDPDLGTWNGWGYS